LATKKLTAVVIDALEDIKARDINLINVSKLTSVFDYIAVASADSTRQTKALARNVMDKVKEYGGWIYGIEGEQSGEWVLVDCGDVVVHIMQPAVREHYKLEELWSEGKLEFPKPAAPKRVPAAPKASTRTGTGGKVKSRKAATTKAKVSNAKIARPKLTKAKTTAPKVTKVRTAKTGASGAGVKVAKETKDVARAKVATKKAAAKVVMTARKKAPITTITTVKKAVAKKPATRKPATHRRKAVE
jgi:ribosome-associated protein